MNKTKIKILDEFFEYNSVLNCWKPFFDNNTYFYIEGNSIICYNDVFKKKYFFFNNLLYELREIISDICYYYIEKQYDNIILDYYEKLTTKLNIYIRNISLNYLNKHKQSNLKEGDKVKILRKAEDYEFGWENSWSPFMSNMIGKIMVISKDNLQYGFSLRYYHETNSHFDFPYFILEKIN